MNIDGLKIKEIHSHQTCGKEFIYGTLEDGTDIRITEKTIFEMTKYFDFDGSMKQVYVYLENPKIKSHESAISCS